MTIKIEAGKYYRTRDGRKVGPIEQNGFAELHIWREKLGDGNSWRYDGGHNSEPSQDLIAEWTDEADTDADGLEYQRQNAPLPYGHAKLPSGKVVDLTAITTPFGLLDDETQKALANRGGPYEWFDGEWQFADGDITEPGLAFVYRVKPKPPAPVVGEVVAEWNTAYGFAGNDGPNDCKTTHRLILPTHDGQLVTGTYTRPDGLVIKVETL